VTQLFLRVKDFQCIYCNTITTLTSLYCNDTRLRKDVEGSHGRLPHQVVLLVAAGTISVWQVNI
jgi:hypothetical protein